jgi:uncharacterized membrane protein YphA (DoxX/SURF4 family)
MQMSKMIIMNGLYNICRWSLGGVFIFAGSTKIFEPEVFALLIEAYGIVPENLLIPIAIVLPALEIIAGLGLILEIQWSLAVITALLMLFVIVLSYGLWIGLDIDCGCFNIEDPKYKAFHGLRLSLYRDLYMFTGVIFIYFWRRYKKIRTVRIQLLTNKIFLKREKML